MDIPWFQVELNIFYTSDNVLININWSLERENSILIWVVKEYFMTLATLWTGQEYVQERKWNKQGQKLK